MDILYQTGQNATALNWSPRITQIEDVRAATNGGVTYTFTYNTDSPVPHLTGITNSINTAETYTFTYSGAATLNAPFTPLQSFGTAVMLQGVTQTGTSLSHTFEYVGNGAGELTKVVFPYQGELRWTHRDFTFSENRTLRQVTERRVLKTSGATPARTQGNTYLTGVLYSTRYIFNRLTYASVTDASGTVNLANESDDQAVGGGFYPEPMSGSPGQDDTAGYGLLHTARGNGRR